MCTGSCSRPSGRTTPTTASRRRSCRPCARTRGCATPTNLRGWVLTIATRKALDHWRASEAATDARRARSRSAPRRSRGRRRPGALAGGRRAPADAAGGGDPSLRARPARTREVAEAIGCSEEAARANASEGRKKLRALALAERDPDERRAAQDAAADVEAASRRAAADLTERARGAAGSSTSGSRRSTPRVGRLLFVATKRGLARLAFPEERSTDVLEERRRGDLAPAARGRRGAPSAPAASSMRTSRDGSAGSALPIDWSLAPQGSRAGARGDRERSRSARSRPTGTSPRRAGSPRAARAAGNALHDNPVPIVVPVPPRRALGRRRRQVRRPGVAQGVPPGPRGRDRSADAPAPDRGKMGRCAWPLLALAAALALIARRLRWSDDAARSVTYPSARWSRDRRPRSRRSGRSATCRRRPRRGRHHRRRGDLPGRACTSSLHQLADEVETVDRTVSGDLLEAKSVVEDGFLQDPPTPRRSGRRPTTSCPP